jgi:hypothetical protein
MRLLTAIERFFERLFERPSARIFRTRLQPIHLQRRIEREMELQRMSGSDRTFVPNRFTVRLHPMDLAAFGDFAGSLAAELADGALSFARGHRYALVDRPLVELEPDPGILRGEVAVDARFSDPATPSVTPIRDDGPRGDGPDQAPLPDSGPAHTMVFTVPVAESALAVLRELRPDGTQREIRVEARPMTIGRAGDNAVVLSDQRVSRHHGRLQARRGALVYTDLESTNGSLVNGTPVREVVLGEGDRITIGDTILVVESVSPD